MGEVMEKCPLGLYITQTPCTINAVRRIFAARISDTYFIGNGRTRRTEEDCTAMTKAQRTMFIEESLRYRCWNCNSPQIASKDVHVSSKVVQ
jgi:hypothetical protein